MSAVVEVGPEIYTEADLWKLSERGFRYELVEGRLVEMSPAGGEHGRCVKRFDQHLTAFIYDHDLGECFAAETGFTLGTSPATTLAPDWSFVRKDRVPSPIPDGFLHVVPDFVLEARSPGDRQSRVETKIRRWLRGGVRVVFDLDPKRETLGVWRRGQEPVALTAEDLLVLEELPGFELELQRVFMR